MRERCEIVARAQELAHKKGLDESKVACEFEPVCDGTSCPKLEETPIPTSTIPVFIQKLEAHRDKVNNSAVTHHVTLNSNA